MTEPISKQDRDEWRRLAEKASDDLPYKLDGHDDKPYRYCTWRVTTLDGMVIAGEAREADAAYIVAACNNFPRLLDAYEQQAAEIATHKALEIGMLRTAEQLTDENYLLKAGAEKLEELTEQFHMGHAAYELGKAIDEKPVGDLFRIGYAWAAYYDLVQKVEQQAALLAEARAALEKTAILLAPPVDVRDISTWEYVRQKVNAALAAMDGEGKP